MSPAGSPAPTLASADRERLETALGERWPGLRAIGFAPLAGDASSRRYVRIQLPDPAPASAMAMLLPDDPRASDEMTSRDAPPTELPFINVQRDFALRGIPVPEIYHSSEAAGILLTEDVGDRALAHALLDPTTSGSQHREWMRQAIDIAADIALAIRAPRQECQAFETSYDRALIARELDVVCRYGLAPSETGPPLAEGTDPELDAALARLGDALDAQPEVLMHRDYHAWNLHVEDDGRVRVIDFQDAMRGPALHDLATLMSDRDTDRFVDLEMEAEMLARFGERMVAGGFDLYRDGATLERDFFVAMAFRTLRVIGRFRFLAIEGGKPGYLHFMPGMARQTVRALRAIGDEPLLRLLAARSEIFA